MCVCVRVRGVSPFTCVSPASAQAAGKAIRHASAASKYTESVTEMAAEGVDLLTPGLQVLAKSPYMARAPQPEQDALQGLRNGCGALASVRGQFVKQSVEDYEHNLKRSAQLLN